MSSSNKIKTPKRDDLKMKLMFHFGEKKRCISIHVPRITFNSSNFDMLGNIIDTMFSKLRKDIDAELNHPQSQHKLNRKKEN